MTVPPNARPPIKHWKRRALLAGGCAAAAAVAYRNKPAPAPRPASPVSIRKAAAYSQDLYAAMRSILAEHRVDVRGKRVVLKPNLVEFDSATAINTSPLVVHAAYEAFLAAGAASVRIAEGPGHRRNTWELAEAAGYFTHVPRFEETFLDLNLDDVVETRLPGGHTTLGSLWLPRTVVDCDLLVSLPKMKTHHWAGATLAMKNLFGVVPGAVYGWPKNVLHWAGIDHSVADLYSAFPRTFAIVDGITGMEGNGPIQGTPKHAGVLIAGSDFAAVDATCCRIMGIDPARIEYLRMGAPDRIPASGATQIGETIASVRSDFALLDMFAALRLA